MSFTKYKALFLVVITMSFVACEITEDTIEPEIEKDLYYTGLDTYKESEGAVTVPMDLSFATLSANSVALPSAIEFQDAMPPIGNQGRYGTCTAWATAYYARTIMSAREKGLSAAELNDPQNIYSPLDMFLSTPYHGANCGGSNIYQAFATMQKRGVATLADVPYENLGNCSQNSSATAREYAAGKIEHFRRVDVKNINEIKAFIQRGCPVVVACNMGPNTMGGLAGEVILSDIPDPSKGHAMCVVGYDDDKGPNGALKIVNSWGDNYGDNGYMWVDYNFFISKGFCRFGYVIEADKGTAPLIDANVINPALQVDGMDLLTVYLDDRKGEATTERPSPGLRDRSVHYNVFNKGNKAITAAQDWNIIYYYYNAFDPENDYGIIFYDYYTDDVAGEKAKGETGDFAELISTLTPFGQWNWWNYVDVPAGYSVGRAVDNGDESDMVFDYELPEALSGDYYFVLFADGFNAIDEVHEQNNFMFFTGSERKPIKIVKGVVQESSLKSNGIVEEAAYIDALKQAQPNTYSVEEIAGLIKHQRQSGELKAKVAKYQQMRLKSGAPKMASKRFVSTNERSK